MAPKKEFPVSLLQEYFYFLSDFEFFNMGLDIRYKENEDSVKTFLDKCLPEKGNARTCSDSLAV